jgi:hypothetical protein
VAAEPLSGRFSLTYYSSANQSARVELRSRSTVVLASGSTPLRLSRSAISA